MTTSLRTGRVATVVFVVRCIGTVLRICEKMVCALWLLHARYYTCNTRVGSGELTRYGFKYPEMHPTPVYVLRIEVLRLCLLVISRVITSYEV
jgi:hypothetical protein